MKRRLDPATAVLSASAVLGVTAGALAWPTAGAAMSICLMLSVVGVGLFVVLLGRWIEDQWERRARGRRAAARQRAIRDRRDLPPLPRRWEVPDYPPEDLRPPAS